MDPVIIMCWVMQLLGAHIAQLANKTNLKQFVHRISAPSPAEDLLISDITTHAVTTTKVIVTIEYLTVTQSSLPFATITSAAATLSPTELVEQIPNETLAPRLSPVVLLLIATCILVVAAAAFAYRLGQKNPSVRPTIAGLQLGDNEIVLQYLQIALKILPDDAENLSELSNALAISDFALDTSKGNTSRF
jgi:hypothetical protein